MNTTERFMSTPLAGSVRSGHVAAKMLRVAATLPWLAVMTLIGTPAVSAQQSEDLQQQVKRYA